MTGIRSFYENDTILLFLQQVTSIILMLAVFAAMW